MLAKPPTSSRSGCGLSRVISRLAGDDVRTHTATRNHLLPFPPYPSSSLSCSSPHREDYRYLFMLSLFSSLSGCFFLFCTYWFICLVPLSESEALWGGLGASKIFFTLLLYKEKKKKNREKKMMIQSIFFGLVFFLFTHFSSINSYDHHHSIMTNDPIHPFELYIFYLFFSS